MKKWIIILAVVVVIVIAGIWLTVDGIARSQIQQRAEKALGVPTEVGSVSIGILSGKFAISGLKVANPPGFSDAQAVQVGHVELEVSLGSLFDETIVSPHLKVSGVRVLVENRGTRTNIGEIRDNLKKAVTRTPSDSESEPSSRRFVIDEVLIEGIKAEIKLTPLKPMTLEIPDIRLNDVGKKDSGVSQDELLKLIIDAVAKKAVKSQTGPAIVDQIKGIFQR